MSPRRKGSSVLPDVPLRIVFAIDAVTLARRLTLGTQCCTSGKVVDYRFEEGKDAWLQREGRIGFPAVIQAIEAGGLLRILPNRRYPGQLIAEVLVGDYVYRVPFRPTADGALWELITLFPSRRATRAWRTRRQP